MATTDLAAATGPATSRGEKEILDELLSPAHNPDAKRQEELLRELDEMRRPPLGTPERALDDLFRAIIECDPERVKALLKGGADPNGRRKTTRSNHGPLQTAISYAASPQHAGPGSLKNLKIIKSLLAYGANPNPSDATTPPLVHVAQMARYRDTIFEIVNPVWFKEVALTLLRHKADPESVSRDHYSGGVAYELWPELSQLIEQVKREEEISAFEKEVFAEQVWRADPKNNEKHDGLAGPHSLPPELREKVYGHLKASTGGEGGGGAPTFERRW